MFRMGPSPAACGSAERRRRPGQGRPDSTMASRTRHRQGRPAVTGHYDQNVGAMMSAGSSAASHPVEPDGRRPADADHRARRRRVDLATRRICPGTADFNTAWLDHFVKTHDAEWMRRAGRYRTQSKAMSWTGPMQSGIPKACAGMERVSACGSPPAWSMTLVGGVVGTGQGLACRARNSEDYWRPTYEAQSQERLENCLRTPKASKTSLGPAPSTEISLAKTRTCPGHPIRPSVTIPPSGGLTG